MIGFSRYVRVQCISHRQTFINESLIQISNITKLPYGVNNFINQNVVANQTNEINKSKLFPPRLFSNGRINYSIRKTFSLFSLTMRPSHAKIYERIREIFFLTLQSLQSLPQLCLKASLRSPVFLVALVSSLHCMVLIIFIFFCDLSQKTRRSSGVWSKY